MGQARDDGRSRDAGVAVLDSDVPAGNWHVIDLGGPLGRLPRAVPSEPASGTGPWSVSTTILSSGSLVAASGGGIPSDAFVRVRPTGRFTKRGTREIRSAGRVVANDNNATAAPARSVWRDVFFLAVLAATVAAAFWSGRVHGLQKVIVVPGPSSFYSAVT